VWISKRRIAETRRLLVETDESVGNLGAHVGYEDSTYFARRFRSIRGETSAA
jgi:AraC-like DNA-binding protein